ncbi:ABC transporter ATP-binding protein [Marinicrinis sediminis]
MGEYAIEFEQVSKTFPHAAEPAVHETSLNIAEGSFITILGASGSGKTTLLKMVNRIHEPTSGRIRVQGQDITSLPVKNLRRKIGYVIQQIGLFPHMTVEQNIATVPKILGWNAGKIRERVAELLELVHLPAEFRDRYPRQLSGGQQQRVGIARAMAGDASIMLMDEPFGALDAITRASLQDELIDIQRKLNKTILFVTHDIDEAMKLGDQIVIMNEGRIQQYGTPLEILTEPANDFVRQLVHADDVFQRLELMEAQRMMVPVRQASGEIGHTVYTTDSLKKVLSCLLQSDGEQVGVRNEDDELVGTIGFEQLKVLDGRIHEPIESR